MTKLINDSEAKRLNEEKQKKSTLQALMSGVAEQPTPSSIPAPGTRIENVPGLDTKVPGLDTNDNQTFLDNLIARPLTEEDIERRKRAATAVGAVGQLGNLISSYANLAGTTQGAAPMTIPGYQGPDIDSWQERARQRQMEYAQIMNGLSAQQWEQTFRQQQADQAQKNWEAEQAQKQRNVEDQMAFEREKFDYNKEQDAAELASLDAYRQGQVKANQTRAEKTGGSGSRSLAPNFDSISAGNYEYKFDRRQGNFSTWNGIYQQLPSDWVATRPFKDKIGYSDSNAVMLSKMQNLINEYAQENPEFMEAMMNKYPSVITRSKINGEEETPATSGNSTEKNHFSVKNG